MRTIDWRKALPIGAAIVVFFALALAYFNPVLEGKQLYQHDIMQYAGMSQEMQEYRAAHDGQEPLWTGSMFSGMPGYQIGVNWSGNLLHFADRLFHGFLPRPADFIFLYLMGMFILLLCLRVDPWLALVGALAFGFSSYFLVILQAGHNSKANAIGYMPMVLGGFYVLLRGNKWLGGALFAFFMALEITSNHLQVTYYLGFVLLLFALAEAWRAIQEKRIGDFAGRGSLALVGVALAALCNAGLLGSTLEYGKYTTRGKSELTISADGSNDAANRTTGLDKDYVTQWSYGKQESFTLLVPDAMGGASGYLKPEDLRGSDPRFGDNLKQMNRYWGDQIITSGPVYLGAIVLLLMLLMLSRAEGAARWWLLAAVPLIPILVNISAPMLAGVLVIAYLIAGIVLWKDTLAYALFASFFLTLLLSWGKNYMPLTDFFLDHVPGYDKFRAVTIILVITALSAPVLGVLYLDRLLREGMDKVQQKRAMMVIGGFVVVILAMAIVPKSLFSFLSDNEREMLAAQVEKQADMQQTVTMFADSLKDVRVAIFTADVWRTLLFVIAGAAVVLLFARKVFSKTVLLVSLGALILLDLWTTDQRYINTEVKKDGRVQWEDIAASRVPFKPTAADMAILQAEENDASKAQAQAAIEQLRKERAGASGRDKLVGTDEQVLARFGAVRRTGAYRVVTLNNPFQDAGVSFYHRSLGGYHGAKLKRYQELIDFHLATEVAAIGAALKASGTMQAVNDVLAKQQVLNMLNTRYIIYNPGAAPIRNLNAFGPAWFVDGVKWAKDADDEIVALGSTDLKHTALVDQRYKVQLGDAAITPDPTASVTLDKYETNDLNYTVRSTNGGVVVFSEIWYGPDWKTYIDGKPVDHVRADYVLRALRVPAGEHKVEFKIESRAYAIGNTASLAGSAVILLLLIAALVMRLRGGGEGAVAAE